MAKRALTATVEIKGLRETLAAFRNLPKEATAALRDAATKLADTIAGKAQAAASGDASPQSALVGPTVKAKRDRVPAVTAGGSTRVGRNGVPAYDVLFGSEFGSDRFSQFHRAHQGQQGAWFFATVEKNASEIESGWNKAADEIVEAFTAGGEL